MDLSYSIHDSKIIVKITMLGTLKFCGMEGSIQVPTGLTFVSASDGDGTVSNYDNGTIYFLFTSNNGKDVTSSIVITTLTFSASENVGEVVKLPTTISDIYDQNYNDVTSTVIGQTISLR